MHAVFRATLEQNKAPTPHDCVSCNKACTFIGGGVLSIGSLVVGVVVLSYDPNSAVGIICTVVGSIFSAGICLYVGTKNCGKNHSYFQL